MKLTDNVNFIINTLNSKGYDAYVVGGSVRDSLMGRIPEDYDIATSATPQEIIATFERTIETGAKFGTVTVVLEDCNLLKQSYEVTTFRIDGEYTDNRKPNTVEFSRELMSDLSRRDFTMNAMAYHPTTGYVDPFDGQGDIRRGLVRAVGNPHARFNEDALRMLRCIRFATKLGFGIEPDTFCAIVANAELMANISMERVRDELLATLVERRVRHAILLKKTRILKHVDSGLYEYMQAHFAQKLGIIKNSSQDIIVRLTILFGECDEPSVLLRLLKLSNDQIAQISALVKAQKLPLLENKYNIKKHVQTLGHAGFAYLLAVNKAYGFNITHIEILYNRITLNNEPIFLKDLDINGDTLISLGIATGVEVGKTLAFLHDKVLHNPDLNKEETLLQLLKTESQ